MKIVVYNPEGSLLENSPCFVDEESKDEKYLSLSMCL